MRRGFVPAAGQLWTPRSSVHRSSGSRFLYDCSASFHTSAARSNQAQPATAIEERLDGRRGPARAAARRADAHLLQPRGDGPKAQGRVDSLHAADDVEHIIRRWRPGDGVDQLAVRQSLGDQAMNRPRQAVRRPRAIRATRSRPTTLPLYARNCLALAGRAPWEAKHIHRREEVREILPVPYRGQGRDRFWIAAAQRRISPDPPPCLAGRQARACAFTDERALELRRGAEHLKRKLPLRRGGVNRIAQRPEVCAK
jgi:hypothetical protein